MTRRPLQRLAPLLFLFVLVFTFVFTTAGRKAPDNSEAQLSFGVQMAKRGLWSEALFRFKQVEKLEPGDPKTLNNIAVALEALGRFEQALDYYQRALKIDPTDKDLKKNYSRFVEFYRSFKPKEPDEKDTGSAGAAHDS